ncbi:MAG: sigma-70 family RNA polymerase sigma factor [Chloroflexota bacterium]
MAERHEGGSGEIDLVRAVASGSHEALAALYDRHASGVHAVALRLTGDRGIAEEVVQETFLVLWNRAELFDPALASLATWLRAIARNRTLDKLRAAGRRPTLVPMPGRGDPDEADAGLDRVGPELSVIGGAMTDPGPEAAAEASDLRATIRSAIGTLSDEERAVVLLAYREGLTQSEIAERTGWPLGTVKTRTRRALARLRTLLEAGEAPIGAAVTREDV